MSERILLKGNDKLWLCRNDDNKHPEECLIVREDGIGASSVCYVAEFGNRRGRLKEYYPREGASPNRCAEERTTFIRGEDHQLLVLGEAGKKRFAEMREEYLKAY